MNKNYTYSLRGFRQLAEREDKRGKDLSSTVHALALSDKKLKNRREQFQSDLKLSKGDDEKTDELRTIYRNERKELRNLRNRELDAALSEAVYQFDKLLSSNTLRLDLSEGYIQKDNQTYRVSKKIEIHYPIKQACSVIKNSTQNYSPSRNSITRALKEALTKSYSHRVYRTDIESFFDSIPHDKLLKIVRSNPKIDTITCTIVAQLLKEFSDIKGSPIGVPRGVSLSSQLAELYLADLDSTIRATEGVLFYARYVDDIIIVIENDLVLSEVELKIKETIANLDLKLNKQKTQSVITDIDGVYLTKKGLNYLGYNFKNTPSGLITELTDSRKDKRLKKINIAFEKWLAKKPDSSNPNLGLDNLLVSRIQYLAGNTKLSNSKNTVAIGIYFSNSILDLNSRSIKSFNTRLIWQTNRHGSKMTSNLKNKLRDINFESGFKERTFFRFNQKKLDKIVRCWEDTKV